METNTGQHNAVNSISFLLKHSEEAADSVGDDAESILHNESRLRTSVVEYSFSHWDMAPTVRLHQPLKEREHIISNEKVRQRAIITEKWFSILGSCFPMPTSYPSHSAQQSDIDPFAPTST